MLLCSIGSNLFMTCTHPLLSRFVERCGEGVGVMIGERHRGVDGKKIWEREGVGKLVGGSIVVMVREV